MPAPESGTGSDVLLMLLADARLPTGAHTQSAGVEPALRSGMPAALVPDYIRARLATATAVEAAAAVLTRHLVVRHLVVSVVQGDRVTATDTGAVVADTCATPSDTCATGACLKTGLAAVDAAWRARTVSPALRNNAEQLGRGYQRLLRRVWPQHPGVLALAAIGTPIRAVTIGVAAAAAGLTATQTGRLIGYDDAQTAAAAVLKIEPMDPVEVACWVVDLAPDIDRMAESVSGLTSIDEMPAWSAPGIERWAEQHAVTSQRLFRA